MLECGHLGFPASAIVAAAHGSGVELIAWSPTCLRAVTSRCVTIAMVETAARVIAGAVKDLQVGGFGRR
jgi:hypothetical protein